MSFIHELSKRCTLIAKLTFLQFSLSFYERYKVSYSLRLMGTIMLLLKDLVAYFIIPPILRSYSTFNRNLLKIFQQIFDYTLQSVHF